MEAIKSEGSQEMNILLIWNDRRNMLNQGKTKTNQSYEEGLL
jgi:hypothetical protein